MTFKSDHNDHTLPANSPLKDKNILVTGAGSDLGRGISMAAAQSGATVLMLDRKQRSMIDTYDTICALNLAEPMMVEFDILKAETSGFESLHAGLAENLDCIHGLAHCAQWGAPLTPIIHSDVKIWQTVLHQYLVAPMFLTRSLLPLLHSAPSSSVVFTVMDSGRKGRAYWGAVGAAFAAIENLSETLADESEHTNTVVNTVDCSRIRTAARKKFFPAEAASSLIDPEDPRVADAFVHLLSDSNRQTGARHEIR